VTHLVEQQASCERSSNCEAKPQSRKHDTKEDAHGKQKPSRIVHPEGNHKSVHAYTFAQPQVGAMRNFAHSAALLPQMYKALNVSIPVRSPESVCRLSR
jgi:hypothetical protein